MNRGPLIVFEGIDGCGKSTQLRRAADRLRAEGFDPVETREPTDGPWGRKIRAMARSSEPVAPETELAWFIEDRREHMRAVVTPALDEGRIVLSDRSYLSTVAYQGARGLDAEAILADSEAMFERPKLALLFVLSPAEGLARVQARGGTSEPVFENRPFQERVAAGFERLEVDGLVRIRADRDEEQIAVDVWRAIAGLVVREDATGAETSLSRDPAV